MYILLYVSKPLHRSENRIILFQLQNVGRVNFFQMLFFWIIFFHRISYKLYVDYTNIFFSPCNSHSIYEIELRKRIKILVWKFDKKLKISPFQFYNHFITHKDKIYINLLKKFCVYKYNLSNKIHNNKINIYTYSIFRLFNFFGFNEFSEIEINGENCFWIYTIIC